MIINKGNNIAIVYLKKDIIYDTMFHTETLSRQFRITAIEYDNITWDTPSEFRIVCVENATILNPSGLVFNNSRSFSFNKSFWRREEHLIKNYKQEKRVQYKVYSLVQLYSQVFQHIVFDGLPRIKLSCQWLQKRVDVMIIIMNKLMGELVREICKLDAKRFLILKKSTSFLSICVPFFVSRNDLGDIPPNIMTSTGSKTNKGKTYLYLARKTGTKRSVVNEKHVLQAISMFWPQIRVVFPTNDWKKDRKIFEKARVIIGPHGGAFSNMIFAPVNTTIIEFLPVKTLRYYKKEDRPCFLKLAYALQFKYFSVESDLPFDFYKPMVVSITKLNIVLKKANSSIY